MANAEKAGLRFGGPWTEKKLGLLGDYMKAYTTALKRQDFTLIYIDAFAGTGYRNSLPEKPDKCSEDQNILADLITPESQDFMDGSARIALQMNPGFDKFVFIEKKAKYCKILETLADEYPHHANNIEVLEGDANEKVRDLCKHLKPMDRAMCFLDPYGMQVEWDTIEAVAKTKRIDLWVLFPLGVAVNRLLTTSGEIKASHQQRLTTIYGTTKWKEIVYDIKEETDLFGKEQRVVVKKSMDVLGQLYVDQLKDVFTWASDQPAVLMNSLGNPLYWMCFAMGNEKGQGIAERITGSLLKSMAKR